MSFQNSIGIDVQKDRVTFVWIKKTLRGVFFEAFGVYDIDLKDNNDALNIGNIDVFLTEFTEKNKIKDFSLYLGIPDEYSLIKKIDLPFSVRGEIDSVLQYEIEKYIPISASKVSYKYNVLFEDKSNGIIQILLQVLKKEDLKPFLALKDFIPGGISAIMLTDSAVKEFEEYTHSGKKVILPGSDTTFDDAVQLETIKATALAFQNFTNTKKRMNFLPERYRKKPSKLPFTAFLILLSFCFVALMVMGVSYYVHGRTQSKQLDTRLSYLKEQVKKVEKIEKRNQVFEQKSHEIMNIIGNRHSILAILSELTVIIPENTFLKEFEIKKQIVRIKGMSKNASLLLKPIEASPVFSGAGFESKISIKENNQEAFTIKMKSELKNEK